MCGENSSPSVRFSFYAPLRISLALSHFALRFLFHAPLLISRSAFHFTLRFSFHAPLLMSHSAPHFTLRFSFHAPFSFYAPLLISPPPPPSHFTLLFSFHTPLPISRSASHFTPPSHFTLPVSFHALLLISCSSHDLNTWNGRHHLTKTSAVVMWFSVFCSVLQKYLGEHFSSVVRVIDINYC